MARYAVQEPAAHRRLCTCGRWRDWRAKKCSTCHVLGNVEPKLATVLPADWHQLSAWVAGEGSVRTSIASRRCHVTVYNTDAGIMDWLLETFGGRIRLKQRRHQGRVYRIYDWEITGLINVRTVLLAIAPITHHAAKRKLFEEGIEEITRQLARRAA